MGYGKGKGKAVAAAEPGARTKVMPQRVTGTLTEWKGKMGWIKPAQRMDHPEASLHKGRIYCGQEDIEAEIAGPGATVSFFVYADGTGLGAMHVRPAAGTPAVQRHVQKPARKAAGKGAASWAFAGAKGAAKRAPAGAKGAADKGAAKRAGTGAGNKGAGKGELKEQPAPDKTAREVLNGMPVAGIVKRVNRQVAFINPDEPVEHELSSKNRGLLYLHMDDMEDSEEPLVGAQVIFFVYVDEHGLGAERCTIVQQGSGEVEGDDGNGAATKKSVIKNNLKEKTRTRTRTKAKGKGELKEPKEKGPSGPDLPRERITTEPVMGEMAAWKRKFGWISPNEPIDHPEASKHKGQIYVHQKDIEGEPDMATTKHFTFHVFVDASGLGAEECSAC